MRLVGKPTIQCDVGDQLAFAQLSAGELDATVDQESMGRHAVMALEGPAQVRRRKLCCGADVFEFQGFAATVMDELRFPPPPRMAAAVRAPRRDESMLQAAEARHGLGKFAGVSG